MLSESEKNEITEKIAEKFKNLSEEIDSRDYFDDPDSRKELVLDIALDYINGDPKILFADLNERKELELAPSPELIAEIGEREAQTIAKERAEYYIEEVIGLIKEMLDELEEGMESKGSLNEDQR
ncbi:MAG: hypothetical protein KGY66_07815 [Candidatus Thermoplasmatota archaeon]|nr:hypothetical protein [Candidatus Thermoplasmatota archaeon]MBS3790805.1 hypothetical protein [Candidatus Thermoplasmatota archaeon]